MKKRIIQFLYFGLFSILFSSQVVAQTYGKIVGYVTDADNGEPLIGANIYFENTPLGAATDLDGTYIILKVPPGKYNVIAEYLGYKKVTYQDVEVLTDLTTTLDFKMEAESFEGEEIVVIAEAPIIRKDLTSTEARVQSEEIDRMAVQDIGDLLSLQAGVVKDAGGAIHIRGGRSSEVSFMVNGITITDDFSRNQSFQVENESIQELQVISGTFNAEYGNAMSGIVNIVTKSGTSDLRANLDIWSGDYISSRKKTFWNIDDIDPFANHNLQGSVSGPIIQDKLGFFVTARRYFTDGYIYGPKVYLPTGERSDSSAVSMNSSERTSIQTTLDWNIINALKLKVDFFSHIEERIGYNHYYKFNPTGYRGNKDQGFSIISKLTHTISPTTYQEVTFAHKFYELKSNLYETFNDDRYVDPDLAISPGANRFAIAGNDAGRFKRDSQSNILKWELTSQVNKQHQVKTGIEVSFDRVSYFEGNIFRADGDTSFLNPALNVREDFTRKPLKIAGFIQDKIEFESLIVNVGLRYDYFDPKGKLPADPADPYIVEPLDLNHKYKDTNGNSTIDLAEIDPSNEYTLDERKEFWYKDTKVKTLLSPRLGVAYPITDEGVLHFSYGIFQQIPEYSQLYISDQIRLGPGSGTFGPFGNPDLEPQRTTMYEVGLQQQFSENFSIDVTGFYRDIRDWVSTSQQFKTVISGKNYVTYINRDFANVRGITLALTKRFANNYAFNLDYTFQIAEGTNSDPTQEFFSQQGGAEPTKILTPLNWDQRHTLNWNIFVGGEKWGADLISRFNTGQPYTPEAVEGTRGALIITSGLPDNSREKPIQFTMDLNTYYDFKFDDFNFQVYAKVYNLLDSNSPVNVFADTGEENFTLRERIAPVGTDPTWYVRPDFYSQPRRIVVGLKTSIY
ncbi:MAG: TonB-dependent receptor [Calditrichaeota bacterium]|nr:MAG: TonB-dependent receptor [Calditrichota bacterium]MBL1207061.1 TonB-dependent receptor [Calditrichota bacterium]NOG46891.1 TonB-dependent receptor [Calditrichota bacterium]